jgi:signal transduction histidine kinase
MSPSRPSRSLGTFLLLGLALVLVAGLAYQAADAARSHRRTAEGTLADYASFAEWQLTQQGKNSLLTTIISSLFYPASRVDPRRLNATLMTPDEIRSVARQTVSWCACLTDAHYFFRYDWRDSSFRTTDTGLSDADLAWARDTVLSYVSSLRPTTERLPTAFGSPDGQFGPFRNLAVVLTNDSYAMVIGHRKAESQLLVFVVVRDSRNGQPVIVYGYETNPATFIAPALAFVHRPNALLPASLVHDRPMDSIVAISVTDVAGHPIYSSPGRFSTTYSAADTLGTNFGRLVMRVGLQPEIAGELIVGGLPRSRLPILVGLFVLTAGLVAMALVQVRHQQELVRLRTEFVSGISHELRTPLAQIRWFAELLHMGKLRSEDERSRSAGIIDQEARRLTYLVENVLNFSRGEKGTNRISPTPCDLQREIEDVLEVFAPLARSRRVKLRADLRPGFVVHADRDALRQILLNLLDNAVKYGPVAQTIAVTTATTDHRVDGIRRVRISVDDEGPGIPEGERARVWEPYVRLSRRAESATGGSGIGLSVVRELVAMHNGTAWVEGAPSGGARVVVELPLLESLEAVPRPAPEAPPGARSSAVG